MQIFGASVHLHRHIIKILRLVARPYLELSTMTSRYTRAVLLFALLAMPAVASVNVAGAQPRDVTMVDMATGSEYEEYLRILQLAGVAPLYPWSIRGFSAREITPLAASDSIGPWSLRGRFRSSIINVGAASITSIWNSAFPYGSNDGAIWAGRGITTAVSVGVAGQYGPLSFRLAPVAFRASNSEFPILVNGESGAQAWNHAQFGESVDYPQRFGSEPYQRIDLGQSNIRLDTRFVSAGISNANQWIGPATEYPFLLGTNAPGFPHVFVGTGSPVNLWLARLHGRVMWGKLYQSDFGPVTGGKNFTGGETGTERLTTSAQMVILPRGIPGLELGIARYFHVPYTPSEPSADFWTKPFKVLFLKNEYAAGDTAGFDNQLAALFFRWTFPKNGFEVYGERGYEDQFYDKRDFLQDIDHEREYMLGFQKTIGRARRIDVIKGEIVNYQVPTLGRIRIENAVYLHSPLRQGHTNRGQLLGTSAGVAAAAASTFSWQRYTPSGRTGLSLRRIVRDQSGDYRNQLKRFGEYTPFPGEEDIPASKRTDVLVGIGVERMQLTRYGDFGAKMEVMQNYNRNYADNVANINFQLIARLRSW